MTAYDPAKTAELPTVATRKAYGEALVALGEAHEEVVALDCDLAVSTQSMMFGKQFPDRFFNLGAAEANMMSISCGLAVTGKRPYASTFAIFATGRVYDQVRLGIAHNELPVVIGASHGGLSVGEDGASHQMIEDVALMRAMPHMRVVVPADYNQAYAAVLESYELGVPQYLRLGRPNVPQLYAERPDGLGLGADVLREGDDVSVFACGHMVARALDAAESLAGDGVSVEVVNVAVVKPIDADTVVASLAKTGAAVTSEEHRVVGGLADAVREVAAERHPVPVLAHGVGDEFGRSGKAEDVMRAYGLTADGIAARVREALAAKG
jgi:transketolase